MTPTVTLAQLSYFVAVAVVGRLIHALWASILIGAAAFVVSAVIHNRHHARVFWEPNPGENSKAINE